MSRGSRDVDKAVSRTLRETLKTLQHTAEDLQQALSDLVAACGSSRPTNALPPILRAQTAAASLAASLDVLSRFVTSSTNPAAGREEEEEAPAPTAPASTAPAPTARSRSAADQPTAAPRPAPPPPPV